MAAYVPTNYVAANYVAAAVRRGRAGFDKCAHYDARLTLACAPPA